MTLLTDEYMLQELDYPVIRENKEAIYKTYYAFICQQIKKCSAYKLSPSEIEEWLEKGRVCKMGNRVCGVNSKEERIWWFRRAMGLQLIYDAGNGKNSMIKGTDSKDDLCRDAKGALEEIGLIVQFGW